MPAGASFGFIRSVASSTPDIPTVTTTPTLWLRADKGTNTTTNGAAVSAWNNQLGAAGNAAQGTSNNQPTYATSGIGGRPAIRFLNTSFPQHMSGTITLSGALQTIFMVLNLDAHAAGNHRLLALPTGTVDDLQTGDCLIFDPNTTNDISMLEVVTTKSVASGLTAAANHILMFKFDGTNSTSAVDGSAGTSVGATVTHTAAKYVLSAGQNASATGYLPVSMYLAEVAIYNAALSAPDVATVLAYMKTRYGIP